MRCARWVLIFSLALCSLAYAQPSVVQKVTEEPLSGGVSFNTITFSPYATSWTKVPNTPMRGRKGVLVTNTSTTNNLYFTGVSGSTVTGTLYPRERVYFNASSDLSIYVSSNSVVTAEVWEIR